MSAEADLILEKVGSLSVKELLKVQEAITQHLLEKIDLTNNGFKISPTKLKPEDVFLPKPTPEQIEEEQSRRFTPEQLEEIGKVDLNNLPALPAGAKTLSQLVIEDREDRL